MRRCEGAEGGSSPAILLAWRDCTDYLTIRRRRIMNDPQCTQFLSDIRKPLLAA